MEDEATSLLAALQPKEELDLDEEKVRDSLSKLQVQNNIRAATPLLLGLLMNEPGMAADMSMAQTKRYDDIEDYFQKKMIESSYKKKAPSRLTKANTLPVKEGGVQRWRTIEQALGGEVPESQSSRETPEEYAQKRYLGEQKRLQAQREDFPDYAKRQQELSKRRGQGQYEATLPQSGFSGDLAQEAKLFEGRQLQGKLKESTSRFEKNVAPLITIADGVGMAKVQADSGGLGKRSALMGFLNTVQKGVVTDRDFDLYVGGMDKLAPIMNAVEAGTDEDKLTGQLKRDFDEIVANVERYSMEKLPSKIRMSAETSFGKSPQTEYLIKKWGSAIAPSKVKEESISEEDSYILKAQKMTPKERARRIRELQGKK